MTKKALKLAITNDKLTLLKEQALQTQTLPVSVLLGIVQAKTKKQVLSILSHQ